MKASIELLVLRATLPPEAPSGGGLARRRLASHPPAAHMNSSPVEVTLDTVLAAGYQDILSSAETKDCYAYSRGVEEARARAASEGDVGRAAALGLNRPTLKSLAR